MRDRDYQPHSTYNSNAYNSEAAKGYATSAEPLALPSLTEELASKLDVLASIMDDTSSHLTSLSDRLFGSSAQRDASGSGAQNKPMGQAAEIGFILDALIDRARFARGEAAQLNVRI